MPSSLIIDLWCAIIDVIVWIYSCLDVNNCHVDWISYGLLPHPTKIGNIYFLYGQHDRTVIFYIPRLFVSSSFIHTSLSGTGFLFSLYQHYQVKKVRCAWVESPRTCLNLEPKICPCRPNWDRCLHFIYKSLKKKTSMGRSLEPF